MKNYFDEQQELKIAKNKRDRLERKKEKYFQMTQPKAVNLKKDITKNTVPKNVFLKYVTEIEKINKELTIVNAEIRELEKSLRNMLVSLRKMKSKHVRIFLDIYVDGLSVIQTSIKEGYSESHIYTLLDEIKTILGQNSKK